MRTTSGLRSIRIIGSTGIPTIDSRGSLFPSSSCCLDSVPEVDNNVDNYNRTASDRPRRNLRAPTKYNPQYNVPTSQWVSGQHASVAKLVLDSALGSIFSMDSWVENQGISAYQAVDHGTLTPVDPTIFKVQQGADPDELSLIDSLSIPQSEQWTKAMTEEISNL